MTTPSRSSTSSCRPALYVYELPDRYRHEGKPTGRGFGVRIDSPTGVPLSTSLFSAATYATGAAFFEAALRYSCRTQEPADADLFFVPTFTDAFRTEKVCVDAFPGQPKNCSRHALFRRLEAVRNDTGVSYLQARSGADHIILTGHQGFWFDMKASFEVSYRDKRLRGAMLFSVEEGAEYPWPGPKTSFGVHSTPWSSMVHLAAKTPRSKFPWRSTHNRTVLVGGAFSLRHDVGPAAKQFTELRGALHRSCLRRGELCEFASPEKGAAMGIGAIASLYWRAVFCMQPVGDGVSRAGIIDAVLLGCIPVLFHPGQLLQWPWHWGAWVRRATVTLDIQRVSKGLIDPIEALAAVPAERIASMQAVIAEHGHCLHYYRESNETRVRHARQGALQQMPSALDITLQGSWLHARGVQRNFGRADFCTAKLYRGNRTKARGHGRNVGERASVKRGAGSTLSTE